MVPITHHHHPQNDVPVEPEPGSMPVEPDQGPDSPLAPATPEGEPVSEPTI